MTCTWQREAVNSFNTINEKCVRHYEKFRKSIIHSRQPNYKFERLYRLLFNEQMYYAAYQRIYAKEGNMTKGADNATIDHMSISRIEKLIISLKDESYQPIPSRRVYIPKKNGKKRPLGIPTFNDKLLQEVVRMILEAIYEGSFDNNSHGFRPKRSCHTALQQIQKSFNGTRWFIEGDIKGFFDNINHNTLIDILRKRIDDERFLRLIRKFLNAGFIENWVFNKTYSGTPQGGIISPILANIYLDQLDTYMREYIQKFNKGKERADNPERVKFEYGKSRAVLKLKAVTDREERKSIVKEIKHFDKERAKIPCGVDMDANFRRLKYVRYADDFLCAVIGTKKEAEAIKQDIKKFLAEKLSLELSDEKTLITHGRKSAKFLGYEIYIRKSVLTKRNKAGRLTRPFNNKVYLKMPTQVIRKKLLDYGALEIKMHNGKEFYKPKHRPYLINSDDLEILERYNAEIRGIYNFYSIANNCHSLHTFKYIMEYSMYKTYASKYRSSVVQICKKYKKDGVFTVSYKNRKGQTLKRQFYHDGFKRKKQEYGDCYDRLPVQYFYHGTSLIDRLKANRCELCGKENVKLDMHHVRKLKDLQGKEDWERHMIARKRKTIALCRSCHKKVHYGSID